MMGKIRLAAGALLVLSFAAHAQFIDERTVKTVPAKEPAAVAVPAVVIPPADRATANFDQSRTWATLATDGRLAVTFDRWAKTQGMKVVWDAQKHVMLSSADSYTGTFEEAISRALSSPAIRQSDYPLEACIYPNNPPVVRITRLGEQSNECPQ